MQEGLASLWREKADTLPSGSGPVKCEEFFRTVRRRSEKWGTESITYDLWVKLGRRDGEVDGLLFVELL